MADRVARITALVGGIFLTVFGAWAVFAPRSFYDQVAVWPPFNHHFVHDIGAFQIGLGLALLLALRYRDALFVALAATATGQTVHTIVHVIDRDLGGKPTDPIVMGLVTAMLVAGAVARRRASDPMSRRP